MRIITIIVFLLFSFNVTAQQFNEYKREWATYYGGQGSYIEGSVIDAEGNIIVAENISIYPGYPQLIGDANYYNQFVTTQNPDLMYDTSLTGNGGTANQSILAKFSPSGELLQSVYLPFYTNGIKISNNRIYILGDTVVEGLGTPNVWLINPLEEIVKDKIMVRLDLDFSIDWLTYVPSGILDFCLDQDSNIYGIGSTRITSGITTPNTYQPEFFFKYSPYGNSYDRNGYLFKLNSDGQLQWATYYGLASGNTIAYSNTNKGELVASFTINPLADGNDDFYTEDAYQKTPSSEIISKFNAITGERNYSTYLSDIHVNEIVCHENYYYFLGMTVNSDFSDTNLLKFAYQPNFGGGASDAYLGKFDININPIWGTYLGGEDLDLGFSLRLKENALYLAGISNSDSFFTDSPNQYQEINKGMGDIFIMKFLLEGESENLLVWSSFFGGNKQEYVFGDISVVSDDTFYLVGATTSNENIATIGSYQESFSVYPSLPEFNNGNGFLVKFAPEEVLSSQKHSSIEDFKIYPNPTTGVLNIEGNFLNVINEVQIFNVLGQKILDTKISNQEFYQMDLSSLSKGVYFLKINNSSSVQKIILK